MSNVVRFPSPSVGPEKPCESSSPTPPKGDVLWVFTRSSAPSKPWISPHAQRLVEQRAALSPSEGASPAPEKPTLAEVLKEIAARAQNTVRDLSQDIQKLPPIDRVERTIATLVPANCLVGALGDDFLNARSRLEGRASCVQETCVQEIPDASGADASEALGQHIEDAKTLSRTELKRRYKLTYSSWSNMKQRCRKKGVAVHPRFEQFPDFLIEVGPRPSPDLTLDRIVNPDPKYPPGRVQWSDKVGQANNREVTITLTHDNGETKPLSIWARETGQNADTLRSRHRKGWTDMSVITGRRAGTDTGPDHRPWNFHDEAENREKAERFYIDNRRPDETPLAFCLRWMSYGADPWHEFLRNNLDPNEEQRIGGIAPHCIPDLEKAERVLAALEPVREWLEKNLPLKQVPSEPHVSRRRSGAPRRSYRRRRDPEAAYTDWCESNPELAYRDNEGEDQPW